MRLGDLFNFKKEFKPESKESLPTGDVAWSDVSAIYSTKDFEKYNPDSLIGRQGFSIYRKMMQDEQIKAVVKFKRDAVTSRRYYFELDKEDSGLSEEEVERRIAISELVIDKIKGSWMDALNGIMSATYNGFSMTEKIFGEVEYDGLSYWGLERLKLKPYDTFYFHVDEFGNILKVVQKLGGQEQEIDIDKFIHFIVNPDVDEHYGGSELREAYRSWFSKDIIIKFRNMWLERHAGGFRWIQPKEGTSILPGSPEFTKLQSVLNNINTTTGIILPGNITMESEYPANNVAFAEAITDYDMAIARALLVPNLLGVSPQGKHGSLAQSDTQLESFLWTLEADANRLEEAINEQIFRHLGSVNFGDDNWPKYKFKPMSMKKKMDLVGTWKELVSAGAVTHTETDEKHIREILEFPEAGEEDLRPVPPTPPAMPDNGGSNPDGDRQSLEPDTDEDEIENEDDFEGKKDTDKEECDETVLGKGRIVTSSAFTQAQKRVDFAVIGRTSEDSVSIHTKAMGDIMGQIVDEVATRIKTDGLGTNEETMSEITKFKLNRQLMTKLRREVKKFLNQGWNIGTRHAQIEIDKAQGEEFTAKQDRLKFISEEFFDLKSFNITGKLSDDALNTIKNILVNGAKGGKTTQEVINQIYQDFASAGMISEEMAREALGQALNVDNPDARLRTIVRTNTFEAINEARYGFFTDPSLGGFVEALEYSAILDSRTTQICQHLDGQIHAAKSDVWSNYRPPNHFNCRSLLIPITQRDTWSEDEDPTIEPQKGFV